MTVKTHFTTHEKSGLSDEEIKLAQRWMRKNRTYSALKGTEAAKLFELFLLGHTFSKIHQQFPQYDLGQIIMTAAIKNWVHDRDKMMHTLQDRVRAKVVSSVLEQVDFLTSMLAVTSTEHLDAMNKYVRDPVNNPKPSLRISSIKEYKDVADALYKVVAGATATPARGSAPAKSPMFDALIPREDPKKLEEHKEEDINIIDAVEE